MVNKKTVSILTPCYNAGQYIDRLLSSVLGQTYSNISMLVIDDGSTDNSAEIIKSYIPKFEKRGFHLQYQYQKNQGQSFAINNGLKWVDGEYLAWPDADDFYASDTTIERMVAELETSDESVSTVRVQYNVLSSQTMETMVQWGVDDVTRYKTDLFEDYLFNNTNSMWVVPGGYMVKVSALDQAIADREIYAEKNAGQNFQLMLPILYDKKCLTIEEYLYNVVDHPDSHSRNVATMHERREIYRRTVTATLARMDIDAAYRDFLLKRYIELLKPLEAPATTGRTRTNIKRAAKAIVPYGVMMMYKRRRM